MCDDASKGRESVGELGDECRKDVSDLAHVRVIPLAEKRTGEPLFSVKTFTD